QEVAEAAEDVAALRGGREPPAVVGGAGRRDGGVHVRGAGLREAADEVAVAGGVAVLERLAGGGVAPPAADVVLKGLHVGVGTVGGHRLCHVTGRVLRG